jgi:CBS domain-containing protein
VVDDVVLRLAPEPPEKAGRRLAELFHRINSVIPEQQQLVTVGPSTLASDALKLMLARGFSQLPVLSGSEVLGVFSYRSFAKGSLSAVRQGLEPHELPVDEFLEPLTFARVTDEFRALFEELDKHDAVLIGEPDHLLGIATAMDVLYYLYRIASPFVFLQEIELALRTVIRLALPDTEERTASLRAALLRNYVGREDRIPAQPEELTFGEYEAVICGRDIWPRFQAVLGTSRERVLARLKPTAKLRNDVLHFRRQLTVEDYNALVEFRDWLLIKIRSLDARAPWSVDDNG